MSPTDRLPRTARGLLARPGLWPLCAATVTALVRARLRLRTIRPADLARGEPPAGDEPDEVLPASIARIAWAVPGIARRMPFRSDCLVQALAARELLARQGHEGQVGIGARKGPAGFEAHAWVTCRGRVVTGGVIDDYARLGT